jgi:hypothetical protein
VPPDDPPSPDAPVLRRVLLGTPWHGPVRGVLALAFFGLQLTPIVVLTLLLFRDTPWVVVLVIMVASALILLQSMRAFAPVELLLGHDGLTILSGRRPRFIPWRLVRAVKQVRFDIALTLHSGEQVTVRVSSPEPARDRRLVADLRAEIARPPDAPSAALAALQRRDRDVTEWRDALRALAVGSSAYRDAAVDPTDIERAVAARDATPELRVAAAIALAAGGDDGRTRVRVAAAASADLPLREALDDIAADRWNPATIRRALRG